MLNALKVILEIQELDMKMLQLMQLKKQRQKELDQINQTTGHLKNDISAKEEEILEMKKVIRLIEGEHADIVAKIKKFESQQHLVKKADEYNANLHEISAADRERLAKEQKLSDCYDKLAIEEDKLKTLKKNLESNVEGSVSLIKEIHDSIEQINEEGRGLQGERETLAETANPEILKVYERLLRNKRDRVVVPLENRCCSGCYVLLTAQHENLVRKGERLIFCEHCSRIHYWQESKELEDTVVATKQRRRKAKA